MEPVLQNEPSPPRPPPLPFVVGWSGFVLATFVALGTTAQFLQLAWGLWVSELVLFAGLAVVGLQLLGLRPARAVGLTPLRPKLLVMGVAMGLVNYLAWAVPLMALAQAVFPKSVVQRFSGADVFDRHSTVELVLVLVGVSVAAPLGEELFFRGFLQRGLVPHQGRLRAVLVTALVFSAFHFDPVGLLARFELGALFGGLFVLSGSLWMAIGAHAANNALSSALFFTFGGAEEGSLAWWVPVGLFLGGNLLLLLLSTVNIGESLEPETELAGPPRPVGALLAPWVGAAVASLALLLALDWRGVKLNLVDSQEQVSKETRSRPDVKELRARARRGEVPLEDYQALVHELGQVKR